VGSMLNPGRRISLVGHLRVPDESLIYVWHQCKPLGGEGEDVLALKTGHTGQWAQRSGGMRLWS
jgi:hypothetical protein